MNAGRRALALVPAGPGPQRYVGEAPPRALGYIRVSTAEQAAHGHSLDQQRTRIRAWCQARGLELVDVVVDEGVSASKPLQRRKGGGELLQRMADEQADVVVVVAIDRLFRDAQDGMNTIYGLGKEDGMPVQSVTEPIDTTSAMGRFILGVWLCRAQLEREQTCERNKAVAAGLRRAGRPYGTTPYGCTVRDSRLYRDPQTWPHRELVLQLRLGEDGLKRPLSAVATDLQQRGIPAPDGGKRWQKTTVARVLRTHGELSHIPALPPEHEPTVSPAAEEAAVA